MNNPTANVAYKNLALIACSTQFDPTQVPQVTAILAQHGYQVSCQYLLQTVSDFGYVDTDQARANNLIQALLDPTIEVLWFYRGGGGALNLLPYLHRYKQQLLAIPEKIIVGFSDITAIHSFLNNELGWRSIHGVNANNHLEMNSANQQPLPDIAALIAKGIAYNNVLPLNASARQTTSVSGTLIGGNHTLVGATFGTHYQPDFEDKILILEDIGVTFRQLDRYLQQLLFLKECNVKAIIFGQYYSIDPNDEERIMYKAVLQKFAAQYDKPVYYFPFFGHGKYNQPFILGESITLQRNQDSTGSDMPEYVTCIQPPLHSK
ncbi:LD-carboxypeptidase [Photobacterium aquimaris]|uniref:LD-carboxypeptidase n=1 Tax=Photobacterium aquimaris TaxID=512643 RepID=A0A2T3ILN7_9GAMM|nr:LD-carboxypeptidase [Photobacterium aquimaris]OBU17753.1 LD-carboxypeptidase [Photobacterium aquimaris]OBU18333.1 LD-carboxypeptidase [Photobacterium aquimaris]PSU29257.1 LD-carboxypeptidase [Photobacterium aquimaris]PSV96960.1 LD-carboxypeptidase [Photobacterium aquimaris]